jgi:uncharacterized protein (TIGR02594 family)
MTFTQELVLTHQERMKHLGYYTGPLDGDAGVLTQAAFTDFKVQCGLAARPYPGPITIERLWDVDAPRRPVPDPIVLKKMPPQLVEGFRYLGIKETPGKANNPTIMKWAEDLDQWYPGDDVPWCGLYTAHCMAVGYPDVPQDFNRLGAREWGKYGVAADKDNPPLGAVWTMWRTHPTKSWNGHVGLVTGFNNHHVRLLSGNVSDSVQELWFPRERGLACRVPLGYTYGPAPRAETGKLSVREN